MVEGRLQRNPKWWVCGECTRLRVRVADRVLLLCMSRAFGDFCHICRLLSFFVTFSRREFTGFNGPQIGVNPLLIPLTV